MRFALKNPMVVSSRVKGPSGFVRELSSLIDFNSEYCVISAWDARALGYSEGASRPGDWRRSYPDRVSMLLDFRGIERGTLVTLDEVSVGALKAEKVDSVIVELEIPRAAPFDLILGRSFLKDFKLELDMKGGYLSLA